MSENNLIQHKPQSDTFQKNIATILDTEASGITTIHEPGIAAANGNPVGKQPELFYAGRSSESYSASEADTEGRRIHSPDEMSGVSRRIKMKPERVAKKVLEQTFQDNPESLRAEEALKMKLLMLEQEKSKWDAIVAAIGDGISIQDADFRITYQNQAHKEIFGDSIGKLCHEAYARRATVCDGCNFSDTFRDGYPYRVDKCYVIDQKPMFFEISVSPLKNAEGAVIAGIKVVRNVTERKQAEEQLMFLSSHDVLTGLCNRYYFEQELAKLRCSRRFPLGIIMADLDDLKSTNDDLGHEAGDDLLRGAATLIRDSLRSEDVVARFGGDEFAVLLPDTGEQAVQEIVARIGENLRIWNESHAIPIKLSLGIASADDGTQLLDALKLADERMYQNKVVRTGRPPRRSGHNSRGSGGIP